jgi:hypothetical protein
MSLAKNQANQMDTVRTMADNYFREKIAREKALKPEDINADSVDELSITFNQNLRIKEGATK